MEHNCIGHVRIRVKDAADESYLAQLDQVLAERWNAGLTPLSPIRRTFLKQSRRQNLAGHGRRIARRDRALSEGGQP